MVISVLGTGVVLERPEDLEGFKVVVERGDEETVANAISNVGRLVDRETAWIQADAVRRMAAGRVGDGWEADFESMLDFAATKGWLTDDRSEIQAHVEWP